jgi:hypothetical protein
MTTAVASVRGPVRAMITPAIDVAAVGGLSIVVAAALLASTRVPVDRHTPPFAAYLLTAAVVWPHFAVSYRLLYATRESIRRYRAASVFFPLALAGFGAFAVLRSSTTSVYADLMSLVASVYLARHYTGQAWGMMASFSFIAGTPFAAREREACRWSLNLLMLWHATWALGIGVADVAPPLVPLIRWMDARVDVVAFASFAVGLGGLGMMTRRLGSLPPARVVVPWLALYFWYALLRRDVGNLLFLQVAHALQYLIFPLRVEHTRKVGRAAPVKPPFAALWLGALTLVGVALFAGIPELFRVSYVEAGGAGDASAAFLSVFVSFVNIHHYFIDGCLYKLRNPEVRRDLFAHLGPVT